MEPLFIGIMNLNTLLMSILGYQNPFRTLNNRTCQVIQALFHVCDIVQWFAIEFMANKPSLVLPSPHLLAHIDIKC